jgi:HTH-type transcriptional regulator / antitoxin HigA
VLACDESTIGKVISGKRAVDAHLALALGEVFEVEPERFLDLQCAFDLAQARLIAKPDPKRATRAHIFGGLPVAEMIKRGWLEADDVRDVPTVERALAKFFGVSVVEDIEVLPHAAKKTNVFGKTTPVQIAWLHRVRQVASGMLTARFSVSAAEDAVRKLRSLLMAPDEARKVARILAEAGIRFVIVESLPSAKIDGVCLWLNDNAPVIGLSLRHDRIDNFWFVLRHELEHVIQLHGKIQTMLDTDLEGQGAGDELPHEERLANDAAAEFCVPQDSLSKFVSRKSPFFAERDIIGFARTLQVHPGLVAGQLQRRTNRYDRFRAHQVKIRSIVARGAMVDGWGDVAPVDE